MHWEYTEIQFTKNTPAAELRQIRIVQKRHKRHFKNLIRKRKEIHMNNIRRKSVKEALNLIEKAREILEEVKDEEQEAYDNLPESLQCGERGEQMQENIDNIEDYLSYLEETENLEEM